MEFTAENLERAVAQFYHTDAAMQAQAHQWLTAAQASPEAWCFVWELLHPSKVIFISFREDKNSNSPSYYFCLDIASFET